MATKPDKPKPGFNIVPTTGFIVADEKGTGRVRLKISSSKYKPSATKATLVVKNANLVSAKLLGTSTQLPQTGNVFYLTFSKMNQTVSVDLELNGLSVGEKVTINGKDDKKLELPSNIFLHIRSNK